MTLPKAELADAAARYERRVSYLHNLLGYHPEFYMMLPEDERKLFDLYFQPDWTTAGNFFRYYTRLRENDPAADEKMDAFFALFHRLNEVPIPLKYRSTDTP